MCSLPVILSTRSRNRWTSGSWIFTSLDKRKFYCNEELRLNRRLAPDIYLEVVEIYEDGYGNIVLEEGKEIIEYAVKMKKLPMIRC